MEEVKTKEDDISQLVKSADDFKDQAQVIVSKFVLSVRFVAFTCVYVSVYDASVCVWGEGLSLIHI